MHQHTLQDTTTSLRLPFIYETKGSFLFRGDDVSSSISAETFNAAALTIIAALEQGYYSAKDPTPLSPREWTQLSCSLTAAIGCGYHCQESFGKESTLKKVHNKTMDMDPLLSAYHTLFHQLAMIAAHAEDCVSPDMEDYWGWYFDLRL